MLTVDSSQVATAEHSIVIGNMTRPPYWSVQIPSASRLSDPVLTGLNLTGLSLTGLSLTDPVLTGLGLTGLRLTGLGLTGLRLTGLIWQPWGLLSLM